MFLSAPSSLMTICTDRFFKDLSPTVSSVGCLHVLSSSHSWRWASESFCCGVFAFVFCLISMTLRCPGFMNHSAFTRLQRRWFLLLSGYRKLHIHAHICTHITHICTQLHYRCTEHALLQNQHLLFCILFPFSSGESSPSQHPQPNTYSSTFSSNTHVI